MKARVTYATLLDRFLDRAHPSLPQIDKDLKRTFPEHPKMSAEAGLASLKALPLKLPLLPLTSEPPLTPECFLLL